MDLKEISFRGILRLRLPAAWVAEIDDEGATYYADEPDSGTLRVSILTFQGPVQPPSSDLLRALKDKPSPAELLPSGAAFVSYAQEAEEEGEPLAIRYWELAQGVAPRHLRMVVISYTLPKRRAEEPAVVEELALLDREIRAAVLSPGLGVLGKSGAHPIPADG